MYHIRVEYSRKKNYLFLEAIIAFNLTQTAVPINSNVKIKNVVQHEHTHIRKPIFKSLNDNTDGILAT